MFLLLLDEGAYAAQPSLESSRSDLRIANAANSLLFDSLTSELEH
jgi:hypothetical protein